MLKASVKYGNRKHKNITNYFAQSTFLHTEVCVGRKVLHTAVCVLEQHSFALSPFHYGKTSTALLQCTLLQQRLFSTTLKLQRKEFI